MKILAIADVHGSKGASKFVKGLIAHYAPDLVVVCGDITQFGPPKYAKKFLNSISIRTLALPGNCDTDEVTKAIEDSSATLLHKRRVEVNGVAFVGLGGSIPTPCGTPFELSEDEIYQALKEVMVEGAVLATHEPAKGHCDRTFTASDLGSVSIARIVSEFSPRLVISAHIHEAQGVEREGGTTFVNPGPAKDGNAAVVTLNGEINVEVVEGF